ncbi:MAG: hypothetical protein AAF493_27855 [Pseudomonadota bacterium]
MKRRWVLGAVVALGLLDSAIAQAEGTSVTRRADFVELIRTVDRESMGIAERLEFSVTVESDRAAEAEFEAVKETLGDFRVLDYRPSGPVKVESGYRWQRAYTLEATRPGELRIPSLNVRFFPPLGDCITADACEMTAHGRRRSSQITTKPLAVIDSGPVNIQVDTILAADADLTKPRGVLPPIATASIAPTSNNYRQFALLIGAAVFLALTTMWLRRRYQARANLVPKASLGTATDRALDALGALRTQFNLREEPLFVELSRIVREFVADQCDVKTRERTTSEVVNQIASKPQLAPHASSLAKLLGGCDVAKFAHIIPSEMETEALIALGQQTVRAIGAEPNPQVETDEVR